MSLFLSSQVTSRLLEAARDRHPVVGLTHNFYKYPARFSPRFVSEAIQSFSAPGSLVLDPYMGGGTTVLEAIVLGRRVVGNDLNSLAAFVSEVKTTRLSTQDIKRLREWSRDVVPGLSYWTPPDLVEPYIDEKKTRNMTLVRARFIKKLIAAALMTIESLPSAKARAFAKCALLCAGQRALDGRKRHTPLAEFRIQLSTITNKMLDDLEFLDAQLRLTSGSETQCTITNRDTSEIDQLPIFAEGKEKVSLVVTSPPYPGVHILYHRWQVDGRKETPAPYWISGMQDGQGASFYNLGDRREEGAETYFRESLRNLLSIHRVMRPGAYMIQMLAFAHPDDQLPRYLANMESAGFTEVLADSQSTGGSNRIWRDVPNRKWHATINGNTASSREVVLVHRAI
jgi:DNA methylase